jgi:DNA mismatch repair protein MutS
MMQQYHEAKQAAGDALLLFRMGDFYELFLEDAKAAAQLLGLSLTSRDKGENPIPMAGFPHHQLDSYLAKIIAAGRRAAVCEQVEDPREAKGIVKRDITRIVSRGTVTDDALLQPSQANYLAALAPDRTAQPQEYGVAWIDVSTGRFEASQVTAARLGDELARIGPVELLVRNDADPLPAEWTERRMTTPRPAWSFGREAAQEAMTRQFATRTLEGFGFEATDGLAIAAAGAVLDYLQETQKSSLQHIDRLTRHRQGNCVEIDEATRRSLEIVATIRDGSRHGSLLGVMDRTVTSMGARLLGDWLANPLTDVPAIEARLDAVAELHADLGRTSTLREKLRSIYDLPRLLARVTTGRASPRDLSFVGRTMACLPELKSRLSACRSERLQQLAAGIDLCESVCEELAAALVDDCPLSSRDGGFIRDQFHAELDEHRDLAQGGKQWIARYQADAVERTGIPSMKIGFNKVFGYYLEVTHVHRDKIPADFIRKQTLKNAERYVTPELKEHEEKVLAAEERCRDLEYQLFVELRELVAAAAPRLQTTAAALAEADVLAGLADLAAARGYVRPAVVEQPWLEIEAGRHPVLDVTEPEGTFVPNDVACAGRCTTAAAVAVACASEESPPDESPPEESPSEESPSDELPPEVLPSELLPSDGPSPSLLLITGPNMAGKSTYIRQVALLNLMAQIGSFVPAKRATIGVADRIFARVGASDDLSRGRSTFMVEMTETARILNTATARSLVILDEIGRGTSTYDGLSLAWAVAEHLHERIGCRTLFATHYHELTELADRFPGVANRNVAVKEWQDQVVFLHQIVPGAADKSYGIHVAQLAGVPGEVNRRAQEILASLEGGARRDAIASQGNHHRREDPPHANGESRGRRRGAGSSGRFQLTLFEMADHPLLEEIRAADLDTTTPLEALGRLQQWQQRLREEAAVATGADGGR